MSNDADVEFRDTPVMSGIYDMLIAALPEEARAGRVVIGVSREMFHSMCEEIGVPSDVPNIKYLNLTYVSQEVAMALIEAEDVGAVH